MELIRRMTSRLTGFYDGKQKPQTFNVTTFCVKPEPQENEPKTQVNIPTSGWLTTHRHWLTV